MFSKCAAGTRARSDHQREGLKLPGNSRNILRKARDDKLKRKTESSRSRRMEHPRLMLHRKPFSPEKKPFRVYQKSFKELQIPNNGPIFSLREYQIPFKELQNPNNGPIFSLTVYQKPIKELRKSLNGPIISFREYLNPLLAHRPKNLPKTKPVKYNYKNLLH